MISHTNDKQQALILFEKTLWNSYSMTFSFLQPLAAFNPVVQCNQPAYCIPPHTLTLYIYIQKPPLSIYELH